MSADPAGVLQPNQRGGRVTGDSTTLPGEDEVVARAASQP